MRIDVVPFAAAVKPETVKGKTVVVIDVLRATSVMITALENGAREVIPCLTIEEANQSASQHDEGTYLKCGERDAIKIDGFDLGNSPLEYTPEVVKGKTLFLTTTNGTHALRACSMANEVFIGAYTNLSSVVAAILEKRDLVMICSGTKGKFSLDDGLCAGMIINELTNLTEVETDDLGLILKALAGENTRNLHLLLKDCHHLNYLLDMGFQKDVEYCLQLGSHNTVPWLTGNSVVLD